MLTRRICFIPLAFCMIVQTATALDTNVGEISIKGVDIYLNLELSSVTILTAPVPLKSIFVSNQDVFYQQDLTSITIPTKEVPLKDLFISNVDTIFKVDLSDHLPNLPVRNIYGDVSGNGGIEPFDASLILQYTVGLIKLPNFQYPNFTLAIADVSGDGTIDPFDASLILRYSVGKITKFPVEEKGASPPIIPLFSERIPMINLGIPVVYDDSNITFPLHIRDAEEILSGKFTFSYLPHLIMPLTVNLGESISEHLYTYQFVDDKVYLSFAGSTPLNGNKSLFELKFKLLSNSIPAGTNLVNILEAQFNEGRFTAKIIPNEVLPTISKLAQNYPNPFNPETWIPYQLAKSADVSIRIYDVSGKLVRTLNLGNKNAGLYVTKVRAAYWDGKNNVSEPVASGVYFYTIKAGDFIATRRMVIIR